MKTLNYFAVAFMMLAAVACSKDSGSGDVEDVRPVNLKVKFKTGTPALRAETGPVTKDYVTEIEKAHAYVLDIQDRVIADAAFVDGTTSKVIETTTAAYTVLVVANYPDGFTSTSYGTRSAIENATINLSDLKPVSAVGDLHGVKHAMLYNYSDSNTDENTWDRSLADEWDVSVKIAPVVTRFEIGEVSGTAKISDEITTSGLESFTLAGIFMNNTYETLNLKNNTTFAGTAFNESNITNVSDWAKDVFDDFEDGLIYGPTAGNVWAYHLPQVKASENVIVDNVYPKNPNIVLHLQDVVFDDGIDADDADLYVVIRSYAKSQTAVNEFLRGRVYQIPSIKFNKTHLAITPHPEDITLTVSVDVMEWIFEPIEAIPGA